MDFFKSKSKDPYCIEILLNLVSKGSAILAEILRMKDYIPEVYYIDETKRYQHIIFDFSYFNKIDYYEDKIKCSSQLRNIDEEFRESYNDILKRFYFIFNNVYKYICDLDKYISQLKSGIYVQFSLENMLSNKDSRHLLCESIYLYGVMLILIDRLIPGVIREKIIVSYYRYSGQTTIENIKDIIKLFENTGFNPLHNTNINTFINNSNSLNISSILSNNNYNYSRPKQYPCDYFERHLIDKEYVKMVIGIIKDNDIYDQIAAYPSPEHRSHALASQASMIFVIMFFVKDYLILENSKMREIVDKHFSDNWNISIYMGYTCDIIDWWKDFKAAKNALNITIDTDSVKKLSKYNNNSLNILTKSLEKYYYEGSINEDYVLDNIENLLKVMRSSNVVLRWYFLHLTTTQTKYKDIIMSDGFKNNNLIALLLATSNFESNLKTMFEKLIGNKEKMWIEDKENCLYRLKELSEYFAGMKNFGKQVKQEDFKDFFESSIKKLESLKLSNPTVAGRKIVILKDDLEKVKKYHYVEGNLQIKQYINEIIEYLNHMLRVANIKNKHMINIAQISDFSYAWINVQDFVHLMQEQLKDNSNNILYLKSVFLKLASILNFPLIRLFESNSCDIESVTNHYSTELVNFVRKVLQIVPISVFKLLEEIINVYNKGFKDVPIKLLKSDIKDYAQLDERYTLAKAVHKISLFTKGILAMEKTFVGIIEVDPKEILEDGIRRELLNLLAFTYHNILELDFYYVNKINLINKLKELSIRVSSIKRAFIYIQDYINIDASRIWDEELHRLVNCYADVEANKFLVKKIKVESKYSLLKYPIPKLTNNKDNSCVSFLGRLIKFITYYTMPSYSNFYQNSILWIENYYNKNEVFSLKTMNLLKESLGIEGYQGMFRLCSYHIQHEIDEITKIYNNFINNKNYLKNIQTLSKLFNSPLIFDYSDNESTKNFLNTYNTCIKGISSEFINAIIKIGNYDVIRRLFNHCLKDNVEYESNCLYSQISNINKLNVLFLRHGYNISFENTNKNYDQNKYHLLLNDVMNDFSLTDETYYQDLSKLNYIVLILGMVTYYELILNYGKDKDTIYRRKKTIEFNLLYMIKGIKVILYQLGKKSSLYYYSLMCQFKTVLINNLYSLKDFKGINDYKASIPENVLILDFFLNEISIYLNLKNIDKDICTGISLQVR